ncbi:hypothetical protein [Phycicoccus jejuensis]|uniref:hypothetical protein n=1 Tax=Phycicoccus jejuensis TaxID=367299 RepID=UPI0004C3289C|nr:hypothetical protein [Phycicoccus jejuensis]
MTDTQHAAAGVPVDLQLKPVADELEEIRAQKKVLEAREKELTLEARALVNDEDGTYGAIVVSVPQSLDRDALAAAYPVTEHPYLYGLAIDLAKAKAHLSPSVLDGFKTPGTPRVSVKR